jgi:hypothetical protein
MRSWGFALCLLSLAACAPPTPPLLRGPIPANSGWDDGGCPRVGDVDHPSGSEGSPELNRRLNAQFPAGSSASALASTLAAQGFVQVKPCATDGSIHRAKFVGGWSMVETWSLVAWKQDTEGRIVWVKGSVAYTGL